MDEPAEVARPLEDLVPRPLEHPLDVLLGDELHLDFADVHLPGQRPFLQSPRTEEVHRLVERIEHHFVMLSLHLLHALLARLALGVLAHQLAVEPTLDAREIRSEVEDLLRRGPFQIRNRKVELRGLLDVVQQVLLQDPQLLQRLGAQRHVHPRNVIRLPLQDYLDDAVRHLFHGIYRAIDSPLFLHFHFPFNIYNPYKNNYNNNYWECLERGTIAKGIGGIMS